MSRLLFWIISGLCLCVQIVTSRIISTFNYNTGHLEHYVQHDNYMRLINDIATLELLASDGQYIDYVSWRQASQYTILKPVDPIVQKDFSCDEITRVHLVRIHTLEYTNILANMTRYGDYFHPSVVKYNGRLLMTTRFWQYIKFQWLNDSIAPVYTNDPSYMGLSTTQLSDIGSTILGEDPRFLELPNGDLMVMYVDLIRVPAEVYRHLVLPRMAYVILSVLPNNQLNITKTVKPILLADKSKQNLPQKNWSPFVYQDKVLFIERINPLRIYQVNEKENDLGEAVLFSESSKFHLPFEHLYGKLRGGSPGVNIGDRYLAFFHSTHFLPRNAVKTYWFGAYTFTLTPPFRLLQISSVPNVIDDFYTGPWFKENKMFDYIIYPMSFFFEEGSGNKTIILSLNQQDKVAYFVRISLDSLLKSMDDIREEQRDVADENFLKSFDR